MASLRAAVVLIVLTLPACSRAPTPLVQPAPNPTPAAEAHASPPHFGMNLASIVDWSREWAFVDVFKHSRPWIEGGPKPFAYDAHGWPKFAPRQRVETLMVREVDGHAPAGRYVATWNGTGTVEIPGFDVAGIVSRKPGRIEFDVRPADGGIKLVVSNGDQRDPIRDIHVWMPGFENAKSPFHPLFLERLAPFEVIRFMKWQRTEESTTRTWDQRAKPEDARWSTDAGAPPEVMIDPANARGANPWFCMPHLADDNYVRQFARLVKQRLRPDLKAYVEYSNEVWNWIYPATHYAEDEGKRLNLGAPARGRFYAQRSVEIFKIWEEELGRDRLVRVLGWQFVNPYETEQVLTWRDSYKHADALAVAPYFGHDFGQPEVAPGLADTTPSQLLDRVAAEVNGPNREKMRSQAALARKYGLQLIAYEGGPHLVGVGGMENNPAVTALFIAANRHPRMRDILKQHYENWFAAGGGVYVAFVYAEAPSRVGSWGVLEFQDQPVADAPKYRAILDVLKK
jgi:hypothetical protein